MSAKNAIHNSNINAGRDVHIGDKIQIVKGSRRAMPYPANCIGADLPKRNYIKYLVERYHNYREADFGRKTRLRYAVIFKNIEAKFKAPTYFIPEKRFPELVDYLYSRIDNTILGRRNNAQGIRNFESFDEYKMKYMSAAET